MRRPFLKDDAANVAVITALMAAPMVLLAVGVIDYSRETVAAAQLQASVDAATLTGAAIVEATEGPFTARSEFDG